MCKESSVKFNNKKGFTLAELLVVLGITTVLLAITMVAMLHYANILEQNKIDNAAKQIFVAAQNHLTEGASTGALREMQSEEKANNDTTKLGAQMTVKPSDMSETEWEKNKSDYYYITFNPSQKDSLKTNILSIMLPFGSIDEDYRSEDDYVIEYNIKTATVYGVFFSDKNLLTDADESSSDNYFNNTSSYVRPSDNKEDSIDTARNNRMHYIGAGGGRYFNLGYYGGAMVDLVGQKIDKPTVKVTNGEKLAVTVTDPNYFSTGETKDQTTGKTETKQLQTYINIVIQGADSGNIKVMQLQLADTAEGAAPEKKNTSEKYWSVKKVNNNGKDQLEYTVNLDDITTQGGHFAELCSNLTPGEDIVVSATCSSNNVLTQIKSSKNQYTNSLFEDVKQEQDSNGNYLSSGIAEVSEIRHIENLDPNISDLPVATSTSPAAGDNRNNNKYYIQKVSQTESIDYDKFVSAVEDTDSKAYSIYKYSNTNNSTALANNSYYPIFNYDLIKYDGNSNTIKNLYVNNTDTAETGDGSSNGGLFRNIVSDMAVSDLTLKDFDITAYKNAGALSGEINSSVSGVPSVANNPSISRVLVDGGKFTCSAGDGNVGGLIGYIKANNKATITDCAVSAQSVDSKNGDAGGFAGEIDGPADITKCYSGGRTQNGKYSTSDYNVTACTDNNSAHSNGIPGAGGFAGKIGNTSNVVFTSCNSTCSANGYYAGGFIGCDYYSGSGKKYVTCYATGLVRGTDAGCFGGYINKSSLSGVYYLDGLNDYKIDGIGDSDNITGTAATADYTDPTIADNSANRETHTYDSTLTGDYPFKMVNTTGAVAPGVVGVHYGDWEKPEITPTSGTIQFAYREVDSSGINYFRIMSSTLDSGKITTAESGDDLVTARNKTISSTSYGLLSSKKVSLDSLSKTTDNPKAADFFKEPVGVVVNGLPMYYYEVDMTSASVNSFLSSGNNSLDTPKLYFPNGKKGEYIKFAFDPLFADAMTESGSFNYGTASKPYQVRTEGQLVNINYFLGKKYQQTCDINMNNIYNKAVIDGNFTGSYSAKYINNDGYSLSGLKQNINAGNVKTSGLFGTNSGTIQYVNLKNTSINITSGVNKIGALIGDNAGTVSYCNTDSTVGFSVKPVEGGISGDMSIGGLIGSVTTLEKYINGCSTDGTVTFASADSEPADADINIGGFIGYDSDYFSNQEKMSITDCASNLTIDVTDNMLKGNCSIGGFAGYDFGGDITTSSTKSTIYCRKSSSAKNPGYYEYLGGFVGLLNGNTDPSKGVDTLAYITESYSKTSINNASNSAYIGGFAGYVDGKNSPRLYDDYAATYFGSTAGKMMALFIGYDNYLSNSGQQRDYHTCHATARSGINSNTLKGTGYRFFNALSNLGTVYSSNNCYAYSTFTDPFFSPSGINYVSNTTNYAYRVYRYLGTDSWTTNGYYPTLINNPE